MKKRILTLVLLLSIGFNVAHAYVIEVLDTHPCQMSEYVDEFHNDTAIPADDICHLHHFFHIAFILPHINVTLSGSYIASKPSAKINRYTFIQNTTFFKPPIYA